MVVRFNYKLEDELGSFTIFKDVQVVFEIDFECGLSEKREEEEEEVRKGSGLSGLMKFICMNVFDIIFFLPGFDLSGLFEKDLRYRFEVRFIMVKFLLIIVLKFEEIV